MMKLPSEPSILSDSITRDMEVCENDDGYWYYIIKEGGKPVIESDLYQTSTECAYAGVHMMDKLHERAPLLNESWEVK